MDQTSLKRLEQAPFLAGVEHHPIIDSTNDRAREIAITDGTQLPLLVIADRQTAGRGRGKNRWWTGQGSLAFSLALDWEDGVGESGRSPLVALVAGLAVCRTVAALLSPRAVGLHWPNDVFVEQRKLAGVLIESPRPGLVILGVGINTNCTVLDAPAELHSRAVTMQDLTGRQHDHTALLLDFCHHLNDLLELLRQSPHRIGELADERCLQRGQTLEVQTGSRILRGRCLGVAPDGTLRLETEQGTEPIHGGTVRAC